MQTCSRCGISKDEGAFSPSYRGKRGTWCRSCFAEYNRHRSNGTTPSPSLGKPDERKCGWCGECYTPAIDRGNATFCSRRCKDFARCSAKRDATMAAKPVRRCVWCGADVPNTMRMDAKFCSEGCNYKAHGQSKTYRKRLGPDARSKPRKKPLIRFVDIAERDGWRCQLCGGRISRRRKHPDPLAASLDHILPVSCGGTNAPANLQLVHMRCNFSKRAEPRGEQLRLL